MQVSVHRKIVAQAGVSREYSREENMRAVRWGRATSGM